MQSPSEDIMMILRWPGRQLKNFNCPNKMSINPIFQKGGVPIVIESPCTTGTEGQVFTTASVLAELGI